MKRSIFTVRELMFAISVFAILFGLAVMGLQQTHDGSGNRASCTNNLRNIALACILHETTYKILPNSGYDATSPPTFLGPSLPPATGDKQQAGWAYQILPFIEQEGLWRGGEGTILERQAFAASGSISIYFCPSRRRPAVVQGRGLIDYASASTCSGLLADMADPEIDPGIECAIRRNRNSLDDILAGNAKRYSGLLREIKDGTSNVMLISEKQMNDANEPPVADDDQGYCAGHDIDVVRTCLVPPQQDYVNTQEGTGGGSRIYRFGSSHPGIIVVAMCDGSIRTISYDIDPQVFFNLGRRRDGAKIPPLD